MRKSVPTWFWLGCLAVAAIAIFQARDRIVGEFTDRVIAPNSAKPYFVEKPCWFQLAVDRAVECGFLHVLEDRRKPAGRTIKLAVVIFKGAKSGAAADPVLMISGGPGFASFISPATAFVWTGLLADYSWLGERDLIVFDHRGVGWSQPALDCPSFRAHRALLPHAANLRRLMTECRDEWIEKGVDLTAYDTNTIAADAEDLRQALRIPSWTLWGPSYGSRVALTMMQKYPQSISSAVLESVLPSDIDVDEPLPGVFARLIDRVFEACQARPGCRSNYPNLMPKLLETLERLERKNIVLPVKILTGTDRLQAGMADYTIGALDYLVLLQESLFSDEDIARVPKLVYLTWRGNYGVLSDIASRAAIYSSPGFFAHGMFWSVNCNDPVVEQERTVFSGVPKNHPLTKWLKAKKALDDLPCQYWLANKRTVAQPQPVRSDIPTLILAGVFDPVTPVQFARHVAKHLPNRYLYEFPANGHDASSNSCAALLIADFLERPDRRPRNKCTTRLMPPDFVLMRATES